MERIILHSDLNNFYASVECLLHPELRDKYVAVCGNREDRHGIVLAKNMAAKNMGVQTGEAIWEAQAKCPQLIIVPPTFSEYSKYSKMVKEIYKRYTNQVEAFGMDECWLDVTGSTLLFGSGVDIAERIRKEVKEEIGLTVSVGVSFNKIFAKLGSDLKKPDAVSEITKENFRQLVWQLPAEYLMGVGRATQKKLKAQCINTIGDIANTPPEYLKKLLGKCGVILHNHANGCDYSPVVDADYSYPIKSIGHGVTCTSDLHGYREVKNVSLYLSRDVSHRLRINRLKAGGIAIGVRYPTLETREFQCQLEYPTVSMQAMTNLAMELFRGNHPKNCVVRALTMRAINVVPDDVSIQTS
ncbi:MAG: DNA polymerase IV, partial [Clostridia bacterium]|nr:DNA polymerase IV [Clostridia bacterium]